MKKIIFVVLLALFCASSLSAQDDKQYAPKAGDIGFAVSAGPIFFDIAGYINPDRTQVNGTGVLGNGNTYGLFGKYFLQDKLAVRVGLGMNAINSTERVYVNDLAAQATDPLSRAQVVDTRAEKGNEFVLRLGAEMRRGSGRVQGFYGAEVLGLIGREKTNYTYGNPLAAGNPVHTVTFGQVAGTTEDFVSHNFGVGVGAFVGAEVFIVPKFSVGAEMSLHYIYMRDGRGETTTETWNATTQAIETVKTPTNAGNNTSGLSMWNPAANIFFAFYF